MSKFTAADIATPARSQPGFRFSAMDAVVILVAFAATELLWETLGSIALLPLVLLGHFFLFCNVFRIRRAYELAWAAFFVMNLSAWSLTGNFGWERVLLVQTPVTVTCLVVEIISPRYHGVGCRWLRRPRLRG